MTRAATARSSRGVALLAELKELVDSLPGRRRKEVIRFLKAVFEALSYHRPKAGKELRRLRKNSRNDASEYVMPGDFCDLFTREMSSLYTLALLLTTSNAKAERCFVAGLEDCVRGNSVFTEWARAWAGRMIIRNAIREISPRPLKSGKELNETPADDEESRTTWPNASSVLQNILQLNDFERFVFVLSFLEGYTDQDAATLLGCLRQHIREAKVHSLEHLAELSADTKRLRVLDTCSPEVLIRD